MKKTLLITALLLTGCGTTSAPLTAPGDAQTPTPAVTVAPNATYTLAQVAEHATSTDCWLALSGKVYNVTDFIAANQHPGGEAILAGCGKDATIMFENRQNGTAHSPQARELVKNFYIGDLQ